MAHCCAVTRNLRRFAILLANSNPVVSTGLRRVPVCALSSSTRWLQTDGKEGGTSTDNKDHHQHFQQQQSEGFTSEPDDSSSSQSAEDDEEYEHNIRQRILQASLIHVHEFGWTKKALEAGAMSEGLPPLAQGMFPRGGAELVHYFYAKCNADLAQILKHQVELSEKDGTERSRGKAFIRDALETRLRMIQPYIDTWSQAMAVQTLPANAPESWTNLLNLADEIWYHAGDQSVDYNWYTKRLALAGVYKSSEIYMLQDKSPDLQDTFDFMDRRLQDFQSFGANKKKLEQNLSVLKEGLQASCVLGRNMLGMNSRNR